MAGQYGTDKFGSLNRRSRNRIDWWMTMLRNSKALMGAVTKATGTTTLALIAEGFATERDPYGVKWKPKKRPDGRAVLHGKTLRLSSGWYLLPSGPRRFLVVPSVNYAAVHQDSQRWWLPRRMMVPARGRGIPSRWKKRLNAAALKAMGEHFLPKLLK